jgi:hypothetical protein
MGRNAERRGTIAVVVVGLIIVGLLVALSGTPKRNRVVVAAEPTTDAGRTTTTLAPADELCQLARRYSSDAGDQPPKTVAQVAEVFYDQARALIVDPATRAEYEAAWNFYKSYNDIGEPANYDLFTIVAQGNGERWRALISRPGLGVDATVANVGFLCGVKLPTLPVVKLPTPNVATTTTEPDSGGTPP